MKNNLILSATALLFSAMHHAVDGTASYEGNGQIYAASFAHAAEKRLFTEQG